MPVERRPLSIRPIDPSDEAEMRAFHEVYERAERAEFPDASVHSLQDLAVLFSRSTLGSFFVGYAAYEGERMVGEGMLHGLTSDSLATARIGVWVPPEARGCGVGRAIVDVLVSAGLARGRGIVQSTATYPFEARDDHPYRCFAERNGFALANTEIERRRQLPAPGPLLDSLAEQARVRHQGYRLRTIVGPIPAELAQGYCDVQNQLRLGAPQGELLVEASRRTPEILADQDEEIQQQGHTRVTVVALDSRGTVVALTTAIVTGAGQPHVEQWGTVVRPPDRGHRLGLAVKVAQVRAIQQAFPAKRFITTTNAETNDHMVAINKALGFEPYALVGHFQRILPGFEPPAGEPEH